MILGPITNIISCLILALVLRLIYKMTRTVEMGREEVDAKLAINSLVTGSHICVTLVLTVTGSFILVYNVVPTRYYRMATTFTFFSAVGDLFLSVILWFILDDERLPAFIADGDRVYPVIEVIKAEDSHSNSSINSVDCEEEEEPESRKTSFDSFNSSLISKRMIDQFFKEVEGPDRDWEDDIDDVVIEVVKEKNLLSNHRDK